jgi:SAM-dependent methyltransferase
MSNLFTKPLENYQGRVIGCAPGTHAALTAMISQHVVASGSVLDIGTHSGALLLRLKEIGFSDLMGVDLDPTRFDVPGAAFKRLELNEPFAGSFEKKFQLVTATDVIEHLDSPRNFLKEIHGLLDEGGWLAISLPNIASWQGRVKFLLKGELWGFGERNYRIQRHISPITREQMTMMMRELGFEVVGMRSAGSFSTPLMTALTFPFWSLSSLLQGISTLGECAIFLARKSAPDPELTQPVHYRSRWKGIPDMIGLEDQKIA